MAQRIENKDIIVFNKTLTFLRLSVMKKKDNLYILLSAFLLLSTDCDDFSYGSSRGTIQICIQHPLCACTAGDALSGRHLSRSE